jgi:hypothetical protein
VGDDPVIIAVCPAYSSQLFSGGCKHQNVFNSNGSEPSLTSGILTITWLNAIGSSVVSIIAVNAIGQMVYNSQVEISSGTTSGEHSGSKKIDLSDHARGVYFIRINSSAFSITRKILLIK